MVTQGTTNQYDPDTAGDKQKNKKAEDSVHNTRPQNETNSKLINHTPFPDQQTDHRPNWAKTRPNYHQIIHIMDFY